jgi:hypothetical protein
VAPPPSTTAATPTAASGRLLRRCLMLFLLGPERLERLLRRHTAPQLLRRR